jgi:hypothetical protein
MSLNAITLFRGLYSTFCLLFSDYSLVLLTTNESPSSPDKTLQIYYTDIKFIYKKLTQVYSRDVSLRPIWNRTFVKGDLTITLIKSHDRPGTTWGEVYSCLINKKGQGIEMTPEALMKFYQTIEIRYRPFLSGNFYSKIF